MKTTAEKTRKPALSKGIAKICSTSIEWYLDGKGLALLAIDVECITNALIDNCSEGELYTIAPDGKTVSGRWNIQW